MIGRGRRAAYCMTAVAVVLSAGNCAAAAQPSQIWIWCANRDNAFPPDTAINACTALINSGNETPKNLAAAFNNRCLALNNKKAHERAVSDCDQAIRLTKTRSSIAAPRTTT
jgi:hypothetical protein